MSVAREEITDKSLELQLGGTGIMYKAAILIAVATIHLSVSQSFSQITINLPKMPKIDKPKIEPDKKVESGKVQQNIGGKNLYSAMEPTSTPILLKNSIYVQAKTHNEYWKAPGQSNYSSWVPMIRFSQFYNNDKRINYVVEYFNPDGSAWYNEKMEQSRSLDAERTVRFESPSPYNGILKTRSTVATGSHSFKIIDQDTNEVLYQGKFKVGKFKTSDRPQEKNKAEFFVDYDWLMPFAMIGFHHSPIFEVGGMPLEVSFWFKGPVEADQLEGRVFYKGQVVADSKDGNQYGHRSDAASGYDERTTEFAPPWAPQNLWKRWLFQWNNLRFDNNGGFNRDNYPKAHYADKNPGEYTIKIYRHGAQVRELSFTIGPDGRYSVPAYSDQIFMPYHRIILATKVIGTDEKWNATAWKTEAFFGNPLSGFNAPNF